MREHEVQEFLTGACSTAVSLILTLWPLLVWSLAAWPSLVLAPSSALSATTKGSRWLSALSATTKGSCSVPASSATTKSLLPACDSAATTKGLRLVLALFAIIEGMCPVSASPVTTECVRSFLVGLSSVAPRCSVWCVAAGHQTFSSDVNCFGIAAVPLVTASNTAFMPGQLAAVDIYVTSSRSA